MSDALFVKSEELEDSCTLAFEAGTVEKSAKSSSESVRAWWGIGAIGAVWVLTGGIRGSVRAACAAATVRGDLGRGEGANEGGCSVFSTGDWKSEKSSSSNKPDFSSATDGEIALPFCVWGLSSGGAGEEGNVPNGVAVAGETEGKPPGCPLKNAWADGCGGVVGVTKCGYNSPKGKEDVGDPGDEFEDSAAVWYDVDDADEAEAGPGSTCDAAIASGKGEANFGFDGLFGTGGGEMGLNAGGGGNANPARGGDDVCGREGGREEGRMPDMRANGLDPAVEGVAEREDIGGGANGGIDTRPLSVAGSMLGFVAALSDPIEPNRASRSLTGELAYPLPLPNEPGLGVDDTWGGGASGGGSTGTMGSRLVLTNFSNASAGSSSPSSAALGTISDRNSMSSEDKARELRGLPPTLVRLENLLRNRETAEGAGGVAERSDTGSDVVAYDDVGTNCEVVG